MKKLKRDRHSHGLRGPILPHTIPFYESGDQLFERLLGYAVHDLSVRLESALAEIEISFEEVPNSRDLVLADNSVPLGRIETEKNKKVVLYQKPIERRSRTKTELNRLIRDSLIELVGLVLGLRPIDIDPEYKGNKN